MKHQLKTFVLWTFFIILDLVIAAGIAEVWVRLFVPTKNICYLTDEQIGVRFCPNQATYGYVEKGYSNILKTNSMGFHDRERSLPKKGNVFRIHIYGDSMVQGPGLQIEDTIPFVVETYLNSRGYSTEFEVMNMAAGDDSTSSHIQTYKVVGRKYEPDLVTCYFMDDFADNIGGDHIKSYSPYHELDQDGNLVYIPPIPKDHSSLWEQFKQTSMLYRVTANKLFESKFYNELKVLMKDLRAYFKTAGQREADKNIMSAAEMRRHLCIHKSWPLTLKLLEHFRNIVEDDGARFLLADGFPFPDTSVGTVYSNEDFEKYCIGKNITYLPMYKAVDRIKSYANQEDYYFKDNHPKPVANREISLELAVKIENYLLANQFISTGKGGQKRKD